MFSSVRKHLVKSGRRGFSSGQETFIHPGKPRVGNFTLVLLLQLFKTWFLYCDPSKYFSGFLGFWAQLLAFGEYAAVKNELFYFRYRNSIQCRQQCEKYYVVRNHRRLIQMSVHNFTLFLANKYKLEQLPITLVSTATTIAKTKIQQMVKQRINSEV